MKIWGYFANGRLRYHVLPLAKRAKAVAPAMKGSKDKRKKRQVRNQKAKGATSHMNAPRFQAMVKTFFKKWAKECWGRAKPKTVQLVMDHETCLHTDESLQAIADQGVEVVPFPKSSPDLNHIEGVWHLVKQEMDKLAPAGRETRGAFLARLRRTVAKMNKAGDFDHIAFNHTERAADVIKLKGAKSKW